MKNKRKFLACLVGLGLASSASAVIHDVTVDGPDAIFLAGRTDVVIPDPADPWTGPGTHLGRHGFPTPEEAMESMPPFIPVIGGDVVKVLDPADGGINFFLGFGVMPSDFFGPEGDTSGDSSLTALDGISGYIGTLGALAGVFLDDSIPSAGPAPATLDFSDPTDRDFLSLSPELNQVFFIGDGETSGGMAQEFVAPVGATRLFFGIPDGFSFLGAPGAYDDNDGAYRIRVGINEDPRIPSGVPEPMTAGLASMALSALAMSVRRR